MYKKQHKTDIDASYYLVRNLAGRSAGRSRGVDFNTLIKKVKAEDKKEKKKNFMVTSVAIATVVIAGIIISL